MKGLKAFLCCIIQRFYTSSSTFLLILAELQRQFKLRWVSRGPSRVKPCPVVANLPFFGRFNEKKTGLLLPTSWKHPSFPHKQPVSTGRYWICLTLNVGARSLSGTHSLSGPANAWLIPLWRSQKHVVESKTHSLLSAHLLSGQFLRFDFCLIISEENSGCEWGCCCGLVKSAVCVCFF